jgi:hypothetical protein
MSERILLVTAILCIFGHDKLTSLDMILCLDSLSNKIDKLQVFAPNNSILLQCRK